MHSCPFCSSTNVEIGRKLNDLVEGWNVWCRLCFAEGPIKKTRKAAIDAWNNRFTGD